jgi:peroxiredoxin Q/BCP
MIKLLLGAAGALLAMAVQAPGRPATKELGPGDAAPDFTLPGSDGKTHHLADYRGKQAVVLAWFPKAFTPGCTAECKSFATGGAVLGKFQAAYFTISCDTHEQNTKFAKSVQADYPILSDPDATVAKAYGVVHEGRSVPERWTFFIGADGKILAIDKAVKTGTHAADVAAKLQALGVAEKK